MSSFQGFIFGGKKIPQDAGCPASHNEYAPVATSSGRVTKLKRKPFQAEGHKLPAVIITHSNSGPGSMWCRVSESRPIPGKEGENERPGCWVEVL